ncbi:Uncharacterised protein [uncultured archaeon]|nr:Uncharacterised protein [uncultured archaeon]
MSSSSIIIASINSIKISDWIQILIALILLVTAICSYLSIKLTEKYHKVEVFNGIIREHRNLKKDLIILNKKTFESEALIFDFYEYVSILFFNGELEEKLFLQYFNNKIGNIYVLFMNSLYVKEYKKKIDTYPYLCKLFNISGLSIKKVSEDNNARIFS